MDEMLRDGQTEIVKTTLIFLPINHRVEQTHTLDMFVQQHIYILLPITNPFPRQKPSNQLFKMIRRGHPVTKGVVKQTHVPVRRTKLQTTTQVLTTWTVKAHDFSLNTSLHGLRYVGDTSLHLVER